jgi:hypothetical protein
MTARAVIVCVSVLGALHGWDEAAALEYPDVYKVPRVLGMGNADVAVGGHAGALFTNPAGLAGLPQAEGWRIAPLRLTVASSRHAGAFVGQVGQALDIDEADAQRAALVELMRRYRGRDLHGEAVVVPGATWRRGDLTVGVGWLGAVKLDGRTHQGFGEEGLLDIDARTLSGPVAGAAYSYERWRFGAGVKRLRRHRLDRIYSIRELVELTQAGREIADEREAGSDVAFDLGVQYQFAPESNWRPRLGVVLQNAGGLDFAAAGTIPPTVTAGVSLRAPTTRIAQLLVNFEYFDLLHRMPQDRDDIKRLRLGAEWRLWERPTASLAFRAGVYQGAYTGGIEWRKRWFRIGLTTYAEELGAYAGQDRDRRYVLSLEFEL